MKDSLSELLAMAAVRVDLNGQPNGSGFFVSPAHVVTCAHVLDEYLETSSGARPLPDPAEGKQPVLDLVDSSGKRHEVVGSPRVATDSDLAVLQLKRADTTVAVVWLDEGFEVTDRLLSFGYPETHPEGEPTTFELEGLSGGSHPHIKFKQGQVRPGMSGSALLNLRTGAVCGVVRKTRNDKTDLGGYGIRVSTLTAAFEDVPRLNADAHRADRRWADRLDAAQRRRMTPAPTSWESQQVEYVVSISQQGDQWLVSATETPGGAIAKVVVDLNTVRAEVPRLFRAWKAQGRIDDAEQSRLLGSVLYRAIMPEGIGAQLERLAFEEKRTVHVSLRFDDEMDADLAYLPWEQLFVRGRALKASLGVTQQATLSRVREPEPDPEPTRPANAVTALLLSAPSAAQPDVWTATRGLSTDLGGRSHIVVAKDYGELSWDQLKERVQVEGVDVLHYIGYGRYHRNRDEIALTNPESNEQEEFVDADGLAEALLQRPPKLVVLQMCGHPHGTVPADPTALALTLVDNGVAAVVAFPYPLTAELVRKASNRLYEQLDAGEQVRVAVQDARRSPSLQASPWSRPALFMRRPSAMALVDKQ